MGVCLIASSIRPQLSSRITSAMAHPIVQQDLHSTQMFILLNAEDNTKITIENSKFNSWHGEGKFQEQTLTKY